MYKRVISLFLFLAIVLALPGVAYATDNDHVYIRDQEEFDDFSDTTVTLSEKEALALFTSLNDTPLMAASGVAAWEGRLFVAADGTFTGIYEDSDADMIYQSYFSGRFSQNVELHGQTYWLWVEELTTDQNPGTRSTDKYGDPVTYIDAPFSAGECMVLTLPGTPDSKIPEMVRGEIGGTLDIWENFSSIYTLTRQSDGWGFFTKPEDFVARPATDDWEILAMNWTGIWQSRTTASRLYIFQEEGGLGDYQVVHVMEKNGETRAIRGSLYSLDEITVDYDVPGILHAAIVGDPYHGSLTLTSFPILDDRMTSWMPVIEVDYEYVGPMDDPNNQIPASVWDLIRIGLDPIAAPTAAPAPNPAPAPDIGSGSVLVDDEVCTIEYLGKAIYEDMTSQVHPEAYFRTSVTNHLNQDIVILPIKGDHSMEAYVDGNGTIGLLLFTENWQHTQFVDGIRGVVIPAGSTMEVYMMPRGYGAGYQTIEELVNAQLFVQVQYDLDIGLSGLERNYELHFCGDETYNREPATGYMRSEIKEYGHVFSFEIPNDWKLYDELEDIPSEKKMLSGFQLYDLLPPPNMAKYFGTSIYIEFSNVGGYFRHFEGDGFTQLADRMIDGVPAYVYQHQDMDQEIYVILFDDGISIDITMNKDRYIADQIDPIIEHFLSSIRFTSDSTQLAETPTPEPAASPAPLPGIREGDVLVDDGVCTITYLGKAVGCDPHFSYGPAVYYRLAITNHTDQRLTAKMTSGTVNGMMLWDRLLFREDHGYTSLRNYAPIPAGETKTVWLWPIGVGYGYRHEEELVNAVIGLRVEGDTIQNREYTLSLNPGESYQPPQRTAGYQTRTEEGWNLSYEIPVDWEVYYRERYEHLLTDEPPRMYDWIEILPPPSAEEGIYHIRIQELDRLEPDFASWKTEETLVDGFPAKNYYDDYFTNCYVDLGNGKGMSFLIYHVETSKEETQPAAVDRFIHSIRFLSVQHPTPVPNASPAVPDLSAWQGYWMTRDDSLAEMIITDNGDGTLHARALFLPVGDSEATLMPQADGSMRFEDQYGNLVGMIFRQTDGALRLTITGGSVMEDEEATEYQGYFARGFSFYPASYDEMWDQTSAEAAGSDGDWLGDWIAVTDNGFTTLHIRREGANLVWDIMLGQYHFSGLLEMNSNSAADLYNEDFFGTLELNRKLKKIAMMNVGSSISGVYDWMSDNTWYGVVVYQPMPKVTFQIPENNMLSSDQTSTILPGALQPSPAAVVLLPIPGEAGVMQVPIARVDAASYIVGSKDPTAYAPFRMTDGEETTAFQFSTKITPLGQAYLYFDFDGPVTLDELWMKNGFWKTTNGLDQYARNSRVRKMTLFVRYADSGDYQLLKDVTLKDDGGRKDWKVINMLGVQNVIGVRIRIDEIYRGSKFPTDVCISEIMFVQHAEH